MNLFEPRRMIAALEQRKRPYSFFRDTFFSSPIDVSQEEHIDIDIDRGGKRIMAAFVNPRLQGHAAERRGFKVRSYKPPYVKPKRVTTTEDVYTRSMGENIYNTKSPAERAGEVLAKDLGDLDDMIIRREEWMMATALQTGKIIVQGEGVDDELDFDMLATHKPTLAGNARWSQHSTAEPLKNFRTWSVDIIQEDSGLVPTVAVFGRNAWDDFMACDSVLGTTYGGKNLFNMRAVDVGRIDPRPLATAGVTYHGYLQEWNLDMYSYSGLFYNDVTGQTEPLMDPDSVLLGCTDARCTMHYGAIKDLKALMPLQRFAKSWEEEDPSVRYLMVQSAPLPAPHQIDAFLCAKVR